MILQQVDYKAQILRSDWRDPELHQIFGAQECLKLREGVAVIIPQPNFESLLAMPAPKYERDEDTNRLVRMDWVTQSTGTIVAVGGQYHSPNIMARCENPRPFDFNPGDRVLYRRHWCDEHKNYAVHQDGGWAFSAELVHFAGRFDRLRDTVPPSFRTQAHDLNKIILAKMNLTPELTIDPSKVFLNPTADWVLLMREPLKEERNGIHLIHKHSFRSNRGVIIRKGPQCSSEIGEEGETVEYKPLGQEDIYTSFPGLSNRIVLIQDASILAVLPVAKVDPDEHWREVHEESTASSTKTPLKSS